jgi:hypothetical protein
MSMTRVGILAAVVGAVSIFVGVFGFMGRCAVPDAPCPSPSPNEIFAYGGLVVLVIGMALLIRAGWRGSLAGWAVAAAASVPATWFAYEVARQEGCPLLADSNAAQACLTAFGEMTAPAISFGLAGMILVVGLLSWRTRRGAHVTFPDAD